MNFAAYRSIDLDQARITSFTQLGTTPFISKRFMLKKYLGLSDSEIKDNEKMWHEEMGKAPIPSASGTDLRNVGVTPGAITGDLDSLEGLEGLEAPEAQPGSPLPGVEAPAGGAVGAAPGAAAIPGGGPTPV